MRIFIAVLIVFFGMSSAIANWLYIEHSDTYNMYLNKNSTTESGKTSRVWVLYDRKKGIREGGASIMMLTEIDCHIKKIRILQDTTYKGQMGSGGALSTNTSIEPWRFITPSSLDDYLSNHICGMR